MKVTVINMDRFHAKNSMIAGNKKAFMLATSYGDDEQTMDGLAKTFDLSLHFLNWEKAGTIYAIGCPVREMLENTKYPQQAYEMGKNL
jgi:hypothetical protein